MKPESTTPMERHVAFLESLGQVISDEYYRRLLKIYLAQELKK